MTTEPGASDYEVYSEGFHDRLSKFWPEPREQLHAGGWARTRRMLQDIKTHSRLQPITRALDLCCGEGATAVWFAAKEGWEVTGVDIVETATKVARARAEQHPPVVRVRIQSVDDGAADPAVRLHLSYHAVSDLVRFAHASVHYMPLPSCSYDVVYGQDPDGLANPDRLHAFREAFRVLRPGGLFHFWHHWIPGPGWPAQLLQQYWQDPITGSPRLSHECYLEDLKAAGFEVAHVSDCTSFGLRHIRGIAALMAAANNGVIVDKWTERTLWYVDNGGGTLGIEVVAYKPW